MGHYCNPVHNVLKESIDEELVAAIQTIMEGAYYFGDGVTNPLPGGTED